LAQVTDQQGEATRFQYDAAGRRTRASYGNGTSATTEYGYDGVGSDGEQRVRPVRSRGQRGGGTGREGLVPGPARRPAAVAGGDVRGGGAGGGPQAAWGGAGKYWYQGDALGSPTGRRHAGAGQERRHDHGPTGAPATDDPPPDAIPAHVGLPVARHLPRHEQHFQYDTRAAEEAV